MTRSQNKKQTFSVLGMSSLSLGYYGNRVRQSLIVFKIVTKLKLFRLKTE